MTNDISKGTIYNLDILGLIFALDFDGTISLGGIYPKVDRSKLNWPLINLIKKVQQLRPDSFWILWTCRDNEIELAPALECLQSEGIRIDAVNDNAPIAKSYFNNNPRKIFAHYYIDDRNMSIEDAIDLFSKLLNEKI